MSRQGPVFEHKPARPLRGEILMDEPTKRRIRRARLRRVGAVFAVVAVIALAIGAYLSPVMRVSDVKVEGASAATAEQIEGMVDLDGQSMMTVNFADTEAQIRTIPMVKSVRIERQWPQTVKVIVAERQAWATWMLGEAPYIIDDEGIVLTGVGAPEAGPIIRTPASDGILSGGDRVDYDAVALTREMLKNVPEKIGVGLTTIEWSSASGLKLMTDAGYKVVIGDSENWDYKLAVWQEIEEQIGRGAMAERVLDLRFGDRPALALLNPPTPAPTAPAAPAPTPEVSQ